MAIIIPTPNLIPMDNSDYQKQNEIMRLLCLMDGSGVDWSVLKPNSTPQDATDYQKQNEILRRLSLGLDNSELGWSTSAGFYIRASAGVIDISTDNTIKLLTLDSNYSISNSIGSWSVAVYAGISYNILTGVISSNIFQASEISFNSNRRGYWSGNYRILNKRLWRLPGQNGIVEYLSRGSLF